MRLGFWWIFIDKDRRGWHDMVAGSKVVVKRKNLLLMGLLTMVILLLINAVAIRAVWDKAESNRNLYQEIIQISADSYKFLVPLRILCYNG